MVLYRPSLALEETGMPPLTLVVQHFIGTIDCYHKRKCRYKGYRGRRQTTQIAALRRRHTGPTE